jgi:hypothetical protein
MGMNDVPRCQHVKVNGTQCGSPALRRKRFCYFHDSYRLTQARLLEDESKVLLCNLPLLEDANSIQIAVMQVIHLLGSGKMDTKVAGLVLYALQTAAVNMKRVNFEAEKVTDVVIDQDTLDLTCINGPQWFERDFADKVEEEAGKDGAVAAGSLTVGVEAAVDKNKDKDKNKVGPAEVPPTRVLGKAPANQRKRPQNTECGSASEWMDNLLERAVRAKLEAEARVEAG